MSTTAPSSPGSPARRGAIALGARPAATSPATRTPARPSPATRPEAARTPGSASLSAASPERCDEGPDASPHVERGHRREGQVDADREGQPRDAAQDRSHGQAATGEDEPPRKLSRQHALDDRLHQRRLRSRDLLRAERVDGPEEDDRGGHGPAGEGGADQLADLLARRRRADEISGLQVLRDVAGLRGGDRHDGARRSGRRRGRPASVHPAAANTDATPRSVTRAIPDVGWDDTPTMPTMRAATATNRTPKTPTPAAQTAR